MSALKQSTLFDHCDASFSLTPDEVLEAIELLAANGNAQDRGAVFTRLEVVNFILDLVGYTESQPLYRQRILEPSFGAGDFLLPIISRLLASWRAHSENQSSVDALRDALCAVELHKETYSATRQTLIDYLIKERFSESSAVMLSDSWLIQGDFLIEDQAKGFDFVVGNPPYVRQELIPDSLLNEYRRRYKTIYDRADLYVPFIERSLRLLNEGGALGFICSDRWTKNRYGGPLRKLIAREFHLAAYIDMVDTDAFHADVTAYPAIIMIDRKKTSGTYVGHCPAIDGPQLTSLAKEIVSGRPAKGSSVRELSGIVQGEEPWLLGASDRLSLIRRIEKRYPTLEEAGCEVGIGVATGADKAFIDNYDSLDVEPDRKLPLVTTKDIRSGEVIWLGQGIVNPFEENGQLADLEKYPRLSRYLEARKHLIARRHCARKSPSKWYRTIDRIRPVLAQKPKLLIPDIKGEANIVYEPGGLYPHHNLYYITSEQWDLRALQAVLLSNVTKLFISSYSTKMRGGCLRFQAQYLRRLHIPRWPQVSDELRAELAQAAKNRNIEACNRAACKLYELNEEERSIMAAM